VFFRELGSSLSLSLNKHREGIAALARYRNIVIYTVNLPNAVTRSLRRADGVRAPPS